MMMTLIRNEKGVALVMVVIIALIGLMMVSTLLFMVTQGTRISGFQRVFRTTDEAGLGGVQIATQVIKDNIFYAKTGQPLVPITSGVLSVVMPNPGGTSDACLIQKLTSPRGAWDTSNKSTIPYDPANPTIDPTKYYWTQCPDSRALTIDADQTPDFTFTLPGVAIGQTFTVYTKILDTVKGNTEESGISAGPLGGTGVVSSSDNFSSPAAVPTLYRIEVQAQDATNPQQRSKYSVLYAH